MSKLTDYFIPEGLAGGDELERRRAEIAIGSVYFLLPWSLISTGFVLWLVEDAQTVLANIGAPFFIALAPLVLKWTGNLRVASHLILIPMFFTFSIWSLTTGGIAAPGISWLLLLPLLALLFQGMRAAGVWGAVIVVSWLAAYGLDAIGLGIAPDITSDRFRVRRMVELVALGTTVFWLFFLKDNLRDWLLESIRQKEVQTRAVLETAPDGILTTDLEGTVLGANKAAARIFQVSSNAMVDRRIQTLVTSLDESPAKQADLGATQQHRAIREDETFPAEISVGMISDPRGNRLVFVLRDITRRKESQRRLKQARDQAQKADRAKNSFLANMSHELRTPLNAVIGYAEMLLEEIEFFEDNDAKGAQVVSSFEPDLIRVRSAGSHLLSLINNILDLSKIEAQQVETNLEPFDVEEICDDIAGTIRPLAADNDNQFIVDLGDELDTMHSDPTKVRQILFNLLSNACKFTSDGVVELRVRRHRARGGYEFEVRDSGIGMSQQELEKVFEAFRQADASTTRNFGGTGLGLTLTRHFCELLDGDIDVSSTPGEGTTFAVWLPEEVAVKEESSGNP